MRRPRRFWLAVTTIALTALFPGLATHVSAAGGTVYVSTTGSDTSGTGTSTAPYGTIGHAITAAGAGSTVIVEPGTYAEMVTISQPVTLESDSTVSNAASTTIIDATGQAHGIVIQGQGTAGTTINGLTVQNAQQEGIIATSSTNLTFSNNIVQGNDTSTPPPNQVTDQTPDIEALHIVGVTNSSIVNNLVQNNHDGGIYLTDETGPTTGNTVSGNMSLNNAVDCGITLANHNPSAGVSNNTIENNVSSGNGSIGIGIFSPVPGGQAKDNLVLNNVVRNNAGAGLAIHAHATGQDLSGNVFDGNTVSGNGFDLGLPQTIGIVVSSDQEPLSGTTTITNNTITNQGIGIVLLNAPGAIMSGNRNSAASTYSRISFVPPASGGTGPSPIQLSTQVTAANGGLSGAFQVTFSSTTAGQGMVLFGTGPGCTGLVQIATQDQGAGTTNHTVTVTGNEMPGTVGDVGIQPGMTYYFEVETVSPSGTEVDNNGGTCYSVTIPTS